jgi:hypothetical protein
LVKAESESHAWDGDPIAILTLRDVVDTSGRRVCHLPFSLEFEQSELLNTVDWPLKADIDKEHHISVYKAEVLVLWPLERALSLRLDRSFQVWPLLHSRRRCHPIPSPCPVLQLCLSYVFDAEHEAHRIVSLSTQLLNDEPKGLVQNAPTFVFGLLGSNVAGPTVIHLLTRLLRGPCVDWMDPDAPLNREIGQALREACVVCEDRVGFSVCCYGLRRNILCRNTPGTKACLLPSCIFSVMPYFRDFRADCST